MRSVACGILAVLCAASVGYADERTGNSYSLFAPEPAHAPHAMYLAGGDIWHAGTFGHAGLLWSPGGLFREGFTLKLLGGAGTYRYISKGGLGDVEVRGYGYLGAVMPGWRFKAGTLEATVYAGLDVQHHKLTPDDPGNRLRGTHFGIRAGADIWYEPAPAIMLAANVSASTIGPDYWTRVAAGWRAFDLLWLGPELQGLGGPTHHQFRAGMHVTSFRYGLYEWSAGFGFSTDTDRRSGVYARIGVLMRQ